MNPGADEVCDATDNDEDCNGLADNLDADALGTNAYFWDYDADGWGDSPAGSRCDAQPNQVLTTGDRGPSDPSMNPGETEIWYNGVDNDCSGGSDYDQDLDGYEHDAYGGVDCDDDDATIAPWGPTETISVPGDFATIQEAIDANCGAHEIQLTAQTYDENIDFGVRPYALVGVGVGSTVIDAMSYGTAITMRQGSLAEWAEGIGRGPQPP